jgi:type II secretory pathway pseudopilin PulG
MNALTFDRERGFTFVDAVAAIVVLAVMFALALPRYLHKQQDLRLAKIEALYDTVRTATQRVYLDSLAKGNSGSEGSVVTAAGRVSTAYGYPDIGANGIALATGLDPTPPPRVNADGMQVRVIAGTMSVSPVGAADPLRCRFTYTPARRATSAPAIVLIAAQGDC